MASDSVGSNKHKASFVDAVSDKIENKKIMNLV